MSSNAAGTTRASVPVSAPALARRAPAELVAHTDEPPPSIRIAAQASCPPAAHEEAAEPPESSVQPVTKPIAT
jgi:hypothetical protein